MKLLHQFFFKSVKFTFFFCFFVCKNHCNFPFCKTIPLQIRKIFFFFFFEEAIVMCKTSCFYPRYRLKSHKFISEDFQSLSRWNIVCIDLSKVLLRVVTPFRNRTDLKTRIRYLEAVSRVVSTECYL